MKILLVEDDKRTADFIIRGLKQNNYDVLHCSNGLAGLRAGEDEHFQCIISDLMMPDMDGLEMIEKLRTKNIKTPVIILSAKNTVDDRVLGLQKGGDDYLTKPFAFPELLARVHVQIRRTQQASETNQTVFQVADLKVDLINRTVTRSDTAIDLQPKEFTLLEYLIKKHTRVVTKSMIMKDVWQYTFDPQTNIVEARICKLRNKIDKGFTCKLIHTIRGVGYVLEEK